MDQVTICNAKGDTHTGQPNHFSPDCAIPLSFTELFIASNCFGWPVCDLTKATCCFQ